MKTKQKIIKRPKFICSKMYSQSNADDNVNKDVFIPAPSCQDLARYEWIGQLMGACFRGKEILVSSPQQVFWHF